MGLKRIPNHGEAACNAVYQVMMERWCPPLSGKWAEAVEGCLCAARYSYGEPVPLCGADGSKGCVMGQIRLSAGCWMPGADLESECDGCS